jgi:hypothetical protein
MRPLLKIIFRGGSCHDLPLQINFQKIKKIKKTYCNQPPQALYYRGTIFFTKYAYLHHPRLEQHASSLARTFFSTTLHSHL